MRSESSNEEHGRNLYHLQENGSYFWTIGMVRERKTKSQLERAAK
jgi:hypothetical protein